MNYKITLTVESETDDKVFEMDTFSIADLEENIIRKAEHAMSRYESDQDGRALAEFDRQREEGII